MRLDNMLPGRYTDCGLENEKLSYTAICSHWLTRLVGKVTSITRNTLLHLGRRPVCVKATGPDNQATQANLAACHARHPRGLGLFVFVQ